MKVQNVVPVIAVKDIAKARAFYCDTLGFEEVHSNEWYVHLRSGGDQQVEIGFVASNHPSQPALFQPAFDGRGVFYSLEVADVDAEYRRLKEAGVPIRLELRDEPWGERHFAISDPHNVILNIGHTDPAKRGQVEMREHMLEKERGVR